MNTAQAKALATATPILHSAHLKPQIFQVLTFYRISDANAPDFGKWINDLHHVAAFTSEEAELVAKEELAEYAKNHPGHAFIITSEFRDQYWHQLDMCVSRYTIGKPMEDFELRRWIDVCTKKSHQCGDEIPASYREITL